MSVLFKVRLRLYAYKCSIARFLKGPRRLELERVAEREAARRKVMETAKSLSLKNAAFRVVSYNRRSRLLGPAPKGEPISLYEIFPNESAGSLQEAEEAACRLFGSASNVAAFVFTRDGADVLALLEKDHPGFDTGAYKSVVGDACYIATK